jgi:hypothetical protein
MSVNINFEVDSCIVRISRENDTGMDHLFLEFQNGKENASIMISAEKLTVETNGLEV